MNKTAIIRNPVFKLHTNGPGHPESPERLEVIDEMLDKFPYKDRLMEIPSREASFSELGRIHTAEHIKRIEGTGSNDFTRLDPDTAAGRNSYRAALHAAGGTIEAVRAVYEGAAESAFVLARPPGHHAEQDKAMGFCLFNNAAIAAAYALDKLGLNRVMILDWDVHHGNGTMHSFYDSAEVLYFSIHQYPHYPGTGRPSETGSGKGAGYTINAPVDYGCGDAEYRMIFREIFLPVVKEFSPQLIIISAGFDAHELDPLGGILLTSGAFGEMTSYICKAASDCGAPGPVFVLEGGYNFTALNQGIYKVLSVLVNGDKPNSPDSPATDYSAVIYHIKTVLKPYWRCFR